MSHLLEHMLFKGTQAVPARGDPADALPQRRLLQREHLLRLDELLRDDRLRPPRARDADRGRPDGEQPDRQGGPRRRDDRGPERAGGRGEQPRAGSSGRRSVSTAFHAHPYRWPVIGWRSDVENMQSRRDATSTTGPTTARTTRWRSSSVTSRPPEALRLVRQHFGPIKATPKPPAGSHGRAAPARRAARDRPALGVLADGADRVEGPGRASPGRLCARRAGGGARRGADKPALPGARREGRGVARRRRLPEPSRPVPLLRERHRPSGRHRGAARGSAPRGGGARGGRAHHRRGARPARSAAPRPSSCSRRAA